MYATILPNIIKMFLIIKVLWRTQVESPNNPWTLPNIIRNSQKDVVVLSAQDFALTLLSRKTTRCIMQKEKKEELLFLPESRFYDLI